MVWRKEKDLVQFKEHVLVTSISRIVVGCKNVVSLQTNTIIFIDLWLLTRTLSAVSGDRSYQTNASSRSSGSTKVNGLRQYGPVQPGVRCSLSRGGALSYSYLYKKQAETHCKSYNCDIITELSNGRFEIGSTTRMKKCKFQSSNIKEQWIKG